MGIVHAAVRQKFRSIRQFPIKEQLIMAVPSRHGGYSPGNQDLIAPGILYGGLAQTLRLDAVTHFVLFQQTAQFRYGITAPVRFGQRDPRLHQIRTEPKLDTGKVVQNDPFLPASAAPVLLLHQHMTPLVHVRHSVDQPGITRHVQAVFQAQPDLMHLLRVIQGVGVPLDVHFGQHPQPDLFHLHPVVAVLSIQLYRQIILKAQFHLLQLGLVQPLGLQFRQINPGILLRLPFQHLNLHRLLAQVYQLAVGHLDQAVGRLEQVVNHRLAFLKKRLSAHIIPDFLSLSEFRCRHSQFFKMASSFSISSGLAICSFMPTSLAITTSSANALAVMAMMGS